MSKKTRELANNMLARYTAQMYGDGFSMEDIRSGLNAGLEVLKDADTPIDMLKNMGFAQEAVSVNDTIGSLLKEMRKAAKNCMCPDCVAERTRLNQDPPPAGADIV